MILAAIAALSMASLYAVIAVQRAEQNALAAEKSQVEAVVKDFGARLRSVSLLGPKDAVSREMKDNYSDYVAPELLAGWMADPSAAPGRAVSSPWPERIEISASQKKEKDRYEVAGVIIEVTGAGEASGGIAAQRPVTLALEKKGGRWLIVKIMLGEYVRQDFF